MVEVLRDSKRVFWEALLLTIVVFILGMLIGISFEIGKVNQIKESYSYSEASILDIFASNNLVDLNRVSCDELYSSNFDFADRIYNEAIVMEKYEEAGKVTEGLRIEHKKYDLLRTLLWINDIKTVGKCGRTYHTVVYLYEYEPEDLTQKATQSVWSKLLFDLKIGYGKDVLLIPIAVDSDLVSLNSLIKEYNISSYPVLIIDDKIVVNELSSVEEIAELF